MRDRLREACGELRRWVAAGREPSVADLQRDPAGVRILNKAADLKRKGLLRGAEAAIELLALAASVRLVRRQGKHDHDELIDLFATRAKVGAACVPNVLRRDPVWRKRYETARKYGGGWPSVVERIIRVHPDCRPSQFLTKMLDARWYLVELTGDLTWLAEPDDGQLTDEDFLVRLATVLRVYVEKRGNDARALRRDRMARDVLGRPLHGFVAEACRKRGIENPYPSLVESATGVPYANIVGHRRGTKTLFPASHSKQRLLLRDSPDAHPGLQSPAELVIDERLCSSLGKDRYQLHHRHHVKLRDLGVARDGRYSVDVVLLSSRGPVCAVDVGCGGEQFDAQYLERRATKRAWFLEGGLPYEEVDLPGGPRAVEVLADGVRRVARHAKQLVPDDVVERAHAIVAQDPEAARVVYYRVPELGAVLRAEHVRSYDDYEALRERWLSSDDLRGRCLPPKGSLWQLLEEARVSRFDLVGKPPTGPGSRKARGMAGQSLYDSYPQARAAAQRHGFASRPDYLARRAEMDPRLPADPNTRWPEEFDRDGWQGYLGTGSPNSELQGLVAQEHVLQALRVSRATFKRLQGAGYFAARAWRSRRSGGRVGYLDPAQAIDDGIAAALVRPADRRALLAELRKLVHPGVASHSRG